MKSLDVPSSNRLVMVVAPTIFACLSARLAGAEPHDLGAAFAISGQVADMEHNTSVSGYTFRVGLHGLRYDGQVHQTLMEETEPNRLTIWVALRNVNLTIASTSISGSPGSAQCGPLKLVLGNRRELWIAFDVDRKLEEADSGLVLRATRFGLPRDNWSVGMPSSVETSGFGMSRAKVVSGLREGLENKSQRIEEQLIKAGPAMFSQVETHIKRQLSPERLAVK